MFCVIPTFGRGRIRWRTCEMVRNSLDCEESDTDERHDENTINATILLRWGSVENLRRGRRYTYLYRNQGGP